MGRASYKAPSQASQLKIRHADRDAALATEPNPSRRGDHPRHGPPRHATPPAAVYPGQHEEVWQGEGRGNRQRQKQVVQAGNMSRFRRWHNRAGKGRRRQKRWQHRRKQYFKRHYKLGRQEREKDLMEHCLCASSSNGCRRQRCQLKFPVHGPQRQQPGKARWQGHCWRSNQQQQQRTKPLHQEQAGRQSGSGQEDMLVWNMKKHCWVATLYLSAAMLQEANVHLRPMNRAGFCLPGMCAPHNTSQYIMDQHEYPWRSEEEAAAAMSGGSGNYSTESEDFPLTNPLTSTAQEDEGTSTGEDEEESTQPAWQDQKSQDDIYRET